MITIREVPILIQEFKVVIIIAMGVLLDTAT